MTLIQRPIYIVVASIRFGKIAVITKSCPVIDSGKVIQPKRRIEILTYTSGQVSTALHDSEWAMRLLGYSKARRSAFWQFVYSNSVPHIRLGSRKILFDERQIENWITRRSSEPHANSNTFSGKTLSLFFEEKK